ncbi:MAG: hypothetical protein Q4C13_04575, partial [Clostridia bacterium]|nr:hypothetical protein [Clostridia bacterium]
SAIFTPDESRPQQDGSQAFDDYGTSETVMRYPWYAPIDELPETVLVAMLRDAGSAQRGEGASEQRMTFAWDAVELLLRVNPRTGEITLPRDEAERAAWRAEADRLMNIDDRNASYTLKLDGKQIVGDVTVALYDMMVTPRSNQVTVEWLIHGVYFPEEIQSSEVRLYIDGVLQAEKETDGSRYAFSQEEAEERAARDGGWQKHNHCFGVFTTHMRGNELPESFTLRVAFDLYDRNEAWERVFAGSFDLTTTVRKSDLAPWDDYDDMG